MVSSMMVSLSSMILIAGNGAAHGGSFVDSLPDPMKPTFFEISFVILLLVWLHFFLKRNFFSTLGKFMDDREAEILAGTSAKAEAAKAIEVRQMEYTEKLKELRARAFEHRKVLTQAATDEKAELVDKARQDATSMRKDAANKLTEQRETAKSELIAQVDALADKMAQHLLKQA